MTSPSTTPNETDFETSPIGMKLRHIHHLMKDVTTGKHSPEEAAKIWKEAGDAVCELQVLYVFAKVRHQHPELKPVLPIA